MLPWLAENAIPVAFMKTLRLVLALLLWVPLCALLGGPFNPDYGESQIWCGFVVGAFIGIFVGCAAGGAFDQDGKVANFLCGERSEEQKKRESVIED